MSQDILTASPKNYFLTNNGGRTWTPATTAEYVAAQRSTGIPTSDPPGISAFSAGMIGGRHALWPGRWRPVLSKPGWIPPRNNPRMRKLHTDYSRRRRRNR